ncbi:unnamed protein product [Rodentolepis nana]|uniref:LRP2-binding protein n=1 Tax=Rodentolepis nana TaxID=102285 RepID=A0A0R3T3X7_RODNA|nr:unnamed protein product [Rodentolepis nana]
MHCRPPCPFDSRWDLRNARKDEFSYYLIRHESGNLVYPSVNLYDDFIGSCKKFQIVEELGKVNPLIISENLENILKKRGTEPNEDRPDDAFQLGQILFEKENYSEALNYFKLAILGHDDPRAKYQIGVMLFDDLLDSEDVKQYQDPQKAAVYIMEGLLSLDRGIGAPLGNAEIVEAAAYNLFLAYVHGYGAKMSDEKALHYLKIAAESGNTKVSLKAQTAMGLFYSSLDHFDLGKAFYWHTEACQNGSIESQGGCYHNRGDTDFTSHLV